MGRWLLLEKDGADSPVKMDHFKFNIFKLIIKIL